MTASFYRLVYISRNEITGDDAAIRQEIEQILATAQAKNPASNVTGALMFNSGCFTQVLEGAYDEVQNTFERIQYDPRHSQVSILSFDPVAERVFTNWSMAYVGQDSEAGAKFRDITQKSGFDPKKLEGDQVFDLLKQHLFETA